MAPMLRTLPLGDGPPARFNGASASRSAMHSPRSLAYDHSPPISPATAPPSGYLRIERGSTVLVADVGAPPDLGNGRRRLRRQPCPLEMSTGSDLLLVNAGRPSAPDAHARALARSTASHNTPCLNDQSSSTLIRNARLEQVIGAVPIRASRRRQAHGAPERGRYYGRCARTMATWRASV